MYRFFHRSASSYLSQFVVSSPNPSPFTVTPQNGFLPLKDPLTKLPKQFHELENLLQKMPVTLKDGSKGLLAKGEFGNAVHRLKELQVDQVTDAEEIMSLFRDYTYAVSAYLLEPCDLNYLKTGEYGLGRDKLPRTLAVPLSKLAKKLGARPFMEYAMSYALYNYKRVDTSKGLEYENLELIRSFSGYQAEHGFILTHVAMVQHTPKLVTGVLKALDAAREKDTKALNEQLKAILGTMQTINEVMETMWANSDPAKYMTYRTFIMGTKNQPMFPKGVVYEGVSSEPTFYRGESGANDSIIPTLDNLLQLTERLPKNELTEILRDFRSYRPKSHDEWVLWVEKTASELNVRAEAIKTEEGRLLYMKLLDQNREFRHRHWQFTKEYIIKYSKHPVATGGSPITTYLPNQLSAVLDAMVEVGSHGKGEPDIEMYLERAETQRRILKRDVDELRQRYGQ